MNWCLPPDKADKFKAAILSGEISPDKLSAMTSEKRSEFLGAKFGEENGKQINALFESKLLLKNVQSGMISWAEKVLKGNPAKKTDIINRIQRMDKRILDPATQDEFLAELAGKKLGVSISYDQAKEITKKAAEIETRSKEDMQNKEKRISYGEAIIDLEDYLNDISKRKMSGLDQIANVANLPRKLVSSLDLSAPFNQGWGMMSRKEFYSAFADMFKYAADEKNFNRLRADIVTRETYPLMKKGKLRITKISDKLAEREEAFMTNLLDKVPGFAHSERGYVGFLNKLRADVFDSIYRDAVNSGEITGDAKNDERIVSDIAEVVNNFTGSGNFGKHDSGAGSVPFLNSIFFSPRKIAATFNMFNPVKYVTLSRTAKKAAIRQLLGSASITATVIALANLFGADFEEDPTSSDFGKIIVGDTRYDVTGGNASYITFLSRMLSGQIKSTNTEIKSDLGGGFGKRTRGDVLVKYFRNKLSPVASLIGDALYGTDAVGNKFSWPAALLNRSISMSLQSTIDVAMNDPMQTLPGLLTSAIGINVSSYGKGENWKNSASKELMQFKNKVGDDAFDKFNEQFNVEYVAALEKMFDDPRFLELSDEEKASTVQLMKKDIKKRIFQGAGFKFEKSKQDPEVKSKIKSIVSNARVA